MSHRKLIKMLNVTKGSATHIKIELNYNIGGMNYFSCRTEERGLYLSVTPVSRVQREGYVSESYSAFSGIKMLVKPMARLNQKVLDNFEIKEEDIETLLSNVLSKNGLEVE